MSRYIYDFTDSGLYTLVNRDGEPLYRHALPLVERLLCHLAWIGMWLSLILVGNYFFGHTRLDTLFMGLIIFHLFLFGCRLMSLMLHGGLKPVLFPPLWVRITRRLQKGEGIELLKRYRLEEHPGLLANLALALVCRKELSEAHKTVQYALTRNPEHPVLTKMRETLNRRLMT